MKIILSPKPIHLLLLCNLLLINVSISAQQDTDKTLLIKVTPVTATQVIRIQMVETTLVRGEIESPNTPHTAAKIGAEVVSVLVDDGMAVKKGQLLATLDPELFLIKKDRAKADILRLQAKKENQQRVVKRGEELYKNKLLAEVIADHEVTLLKQVEAELLIAQTQLKEAQYQLSHTQILSPVNGVIQQRMVSAGDYLKIGQKLFHLVSMENLRARIYLPDSLSARIHTGMPVELTLLNQTVTGEISHLRPMLEKGNKALHALVSFDNSYQWIPGAIITAKLILKNLPQALMVPAKSLVQRPAGIILYEIQGTKVKQRIVSVGIQQEQFVEIIAGINEGDMIVVDGATWLSDGAQITVQKSEY